MVSLYSRVLQFFLLMRKTLEHLFFISLKLLVDEIQIDIPMYLCNSYGVQLGCLEIKKILTLLVWS